MRNKDEIGFEIFDKDIKMQAHTDWRAKMLFGFLQISPSYRLANLLRTGKISSDKPRIPKCIDQILDMYDLFGSVWDTNFDEFWSRYNNTIDNASSQKLPVELIAKINKNSSKERTQVTNEFKKLYQFFRTVANTQEKDNIMILSIDTQHDRNKILKSLKKFIDAEIPLHKMGAGNKEFRFVAGKLRESTLHMALHVLRVRTLLPDVPLYIIGNEAGVSPENYTENYAARNEIDSKARRLMEILTSRHLKRAFIIAENAALGHFPSFDPLPDELSNGQFDFQFLYKKFAKSWELEAI